MEIISKLRKVSLTHAIALLRLPYKTPFKASEIENDLLEFGDIPGLIQHLRKSGYLYCVAHSPAKKLGNSYQLTDRGREVVNLFEILLGENHASRTNS